MTAMHVAIELRVLCCADAALLAKCVNIATTIVCGLAGIASVAGATMGRGAAVQAPAEPVAALIGTPAFHALKSRIG